MKEISAAEKEFMNLQHQFRGLVSAFKSTKFTTEKLTKKPAPQLQRQRPRSFRLGFRNLMLDARASLLVNQFSQFLEWVDLQMRKNVINVQNIPIGYDELLGLYTRAPVVSLDREIIWLSRRFLIHAERIDAFRAAADGVERLVFSDEIETAIDGIKHIEEALGTTLWSVQLRIALEHMAGGLERQKKYTAELRGIYKRGLLGFVAYHTSVRNEGRSTSRKYCEDIKARIARHQYYDDSTKAYARYRLAGECPDDESGLADILRIEQSHALIDGYETFIAVAQQIVRHKEWTNTRETLAGCLRELAAQISDFRLSKILYLLDGHSQVNRDFRLRDTSISDALFTSDICLATRTALSELKAPADVDCWQYIYAGIALSHATRLRPGAFKTAPDFPSIIGDVLRRFGGEVDAIAQLEKATVNLKGLPAAAGILDLIPILRRPEPDNPWEPWLISMNSRTIGVEDFAPGTYGSFLNVLSERQGHIGPTVAAWGRLHGQNHQVTGVSDVAETLFSAAGLIRERCFTNAIPILTPFYTAGQPESIRALAALMLLHAHFSQGNRQQVIELIAGEGSRSPVHADLVPIVPSLSSYEWEDFAAVTTPLATPIALHLLWTRTENSLTASRVRNTTGTAVRRSGVRLPHLMADLVGQYPRHQLIYFLAEVCVPEIIDVSRVLKGTRAIIEERMAICTKLIDLDPSKVGAYKDDVQECSNTLALADGQSIVDRTRIHVDVEALLRWASKEFSEDFSRYRDLADLDIRDKQNFDDVLKELSTMTVSSRRQPVSAENEADAVLLSMLNRCHDEFLCNPNFGLDFYLSKRIRHQSFVGRIRAPLEFSQLITTRPSEFGQYNRNDHWINKFTTLGPQEKDALSSIFNKFSAKFDELLNYAKDKKFHLHSQEYPQGLFGFDFSPHAIGLLRTLLQSDTTLPDFVDTAVVIFWGALQASLDEARKYVSVELKTKVCQAFDELRAAVRKIADRDDAFLELDTEIGLRSTDVQRALDEVSKWFCHSNTEDLKRAFTVDQLFDTAVKSAMKCQSPPFDPVITRDDITSDCELLSSVSLVLVHDVLFTAFGNARAYSGLDKPEIVIRAIISKETGTFTIEVISEAGEANRAEQLEELQVIRQLIDNRNFERRSRKEGKSGIIKLAAVAYQSAKGGVSFGFDENHFSLKVTYSLIVEEAVAQYGAANE